LASGIERLFLRACRGATTVTDLRLDPARPLVVIFGENGSGKSTLADGIDIVCNGRCGTLDERSSASTRQHLAAAGREARDVLVELTVAGRTWTATLAGRGIGVVGPEPRPVAHILRRSQLLRLVEAQPSHRYEELKRFIEVDGVARGEQALASAVKSAQTVRQQERRRNEDAVEALHRLWVAEGRPGGVDATAESWAAAKILPGAAELSATAARYQEVLECLDATAVARDPAVASHAALREKRAAVAAIEAEIATAGGLTAAEGMDLIGLLQEAQRYLAPPRASAACPVCGQPARDEELRRQIDARLEAVQALKALRDRREAALRERDAAMLHAEQCRERFVSLCRALAQIASINEAGTATELPIDWTQYDRLLASDADTGLEPARQANGLLAAFTGIRGRLARVVEEAQADRNQFNAIAQYYGRVAEGAERIREADALHRRLEAALEIVRAERLGFVQRALDDVAAECNRLYRRIHPEEGLALARFRLDENRKGSLHQEAQFGDLADVPPQAYFSESHLDTLAFCCFLAIARGASRGDALLVLDDVFTTVDADHLNRIGELLVEESPHFGQVILTTHSRAWRDHYRHLAASGASIQVVELEPWTAECGVRARNLTEELASAAPGRYTDR
jgi:DNA repair exonuclease SbcCD ATPase subunit